MKFLPFWTVEPNLVKEKNSRLHSVRLDEAALPAISVALLLSLRSRGAGGWDCDCFLKTRDVSSMLNFIFF